LPALWSVLTPVFLLIHIVPGDPVSGKVAQLRHALGLALPLDVRYDHYLWQLAHGDFGHSFKFQASVRRVTFFLKAIPPPCSSFFLPLVCAAIAIPSPPPRASRLTALAEGVLSE
jgi:ABC-type dipeptide/oligopeptide/nickel transport system permease component